MAPSVGQTDRALDPRSELWRQLALDQPPERFFPAWLTLQCTMLRGCTRAVLVLRDPTTGRFRPYATYPHAAPVDPALTGIAEAALAERQGQHAETQDGTLLAYPVVVDDVVEGVVALRSGDGPPEHHVEQLQWGGIWLRTYLAQSQVDDTLLTNDRLMRVLDLVATVLEHDRFTAAALALTTELCDQLGLDRASLGFRDRGQTRVVALSRSATLVEEMNLVAALKVAMDDAMDHDRVVIHPRDGSDAHQRCIEAGASPHITTIPLHHAQRVCGALLVESREPLDTVTVEVLKSVALAAGPMLEVKRLEARSLLRTVAGAWADQATRLLGPGHLGRKLAAALVLVAAAALAWIDIDYRVSADSVLEGSVQRTIAAPLDGYLIAAPYRAGDRVARGDRLAALDDRDLRLQLLEVQTERAQLVRQRQQAIAARDRAATQVIEAQVDQADARLALLEEQIDHAHIDAPFDALIIEGDLSQSLGAAVERGAVMFVLAPLDGYRVVLDVDEHDIGYIEPGQAGELVLTALPGEPFAIEVARVTPVAHVTEGVNAFRVEADLLAPADRLRPGMRGVGKVLIDRRPAGWVWGRRLYDWLRLQVWKWTP